MAILANNMLLLNDVNYGYWQVRMRANLRGADEDIWTVVQSGWEEPCVMQEDGLKTLKPKTKWTATEKKLSRFYAKALDTIFSSVDGKQFELIQGCESAKEAWDILQNAFEGTTKVRRIRLDLLASQFEDIRMTDDEKIGDFSAKLSSIANESQVLGKKYEDAKLVKKFLRCLPTKFAAHKAAINLTMNTDELKFAEVVGILKAEEMELESKFSKSAQDSTVTVDEDIQRAQKLEESIHLMIQKLEETMNLLYKMSNDRLPREEEKNKMQGAVCFNCHGIGHVKTDCPSFKRKEIKCNGCNGYGHIKSDCVNTKKMKKRRIWNDKKPERKEDALNFVALHGAMGSGKDITKGEFRASCVSHTNSDVSHSDAESDIDVDLLAEYQVLFGQFAKLSEENIQLIKDTTMLKAKVNILELETNNKSETGVSKEEKESDPHSSQKKISEQAYNLKSMETKYDQTKQLLNEEREKSQLLQRELSENYKKLRMLNRGSATLDHILSVGQPPKVNWGLGYKGAAPKDQAIPVDDIKFVKGTPSNPESSSKAEKRYTSTPVKKEPNDQTKLHSPKPAITRKNGCLFCGNHGHKVDFCYSRRHQIERAWRMNLCYVEPRRYGYVWIAKKDLYPKFTKGVSHEHTNVSYTRMVDQYTELEEPVRWRRRS